MACTTLPSFTLHSATKVALTATNTAIAEFNFDFSAASMLSCAESAISLMRVSGARIGWRVKNAAASGGVLRSLRQCVDAPPKAEALCDVLRDHQQNHSGARAEPSLAWRA